MPAAAAPLPAGGRLAATQAQIEHVIVIYQENRSFDNLFGQLLGADGLANAAAALPQTDLAGVPFGALPQPTNTTVPTGGRGPTVPG